MALTPEQQYAQVAANRSPEDRAFYEDQQRRIALQQAQTDAGLWGPTGPGPEPTGATAAAAMTASAPAPTGGGSVDPFAEIGGGVQTPDGSWLPRNHPAAAQYLQAQPVAQPTASATTPGAPGASGPDLSNQAISNQVRTSYLDMARQSKTPDANDPAIRAQADAFSANVERQRRNYVADQAESLGPMATGALRGQERMSAERAGQATGSFEAELVGREIQARRSEIMQSLQMLSSILSDQERMALQKELAEMDAQLRRLGIETSARTAGAQIGEQARQFNNQLGFQIGDREAFYNNQALQYLF